MRLDELNKRKILVLGLGREGLSSAKYLRRAFPGEPIGIADRHKLEELPQEAQNWIASQGELSLHLGPDYLEALKSCEIAIRTPGISIDLPQIRKAQARGCVITSQSALFLANCRGLTIGVSGTKGKSTTSALIFEMLKAAGRKAFLLGNIGVPALDYLESDTPDSIFVLELSSYQLEELGVSPRIAVLLSIYPEHLTYHGSFERYVEAKAQITLSQKTYDKFFYNLDSEICRSIAGRSPAERFSCSAAAEKSVAHAPNLPGRHNRSNILIASAVAKSLNVPDQTIESALANFNSLEHRFEFVGTFGGIDFYNASLATIPQATLAHLEALEGRVETLILGGHDRNLEFGELALGVLEARVRNLMLFPETGKRIWQAIEQCLESGAGQVRPHVFFVSSMPEAVKLCYQHTSPGKVCLLSPAASSFGLFKDYRERGEVFKRCVRELEE